MAITSQSLLRVLTSVFSSPFRCEGDPSNDTKYIVSPESLANASGFVVESSRPYKDSCKAVVRFGAFSRNLLETWFDSEENLRQAFEFAKGVSDDVFLDVRVSGVRVYDAEGFIDQRNRKWQKEGIALKVTFWDIPSGSEDYFYYLAIVAVLGFALYASGLVVDDYDGALEGTRHVVALSRYERNAVNRAKCISYHGSACKVCGFDFAKRYGDFASGFIEVHHIKPLSQSDGPIFIDPKIDLVPLCPNCHAAIHMTNPPMLPEELRSLLKEY